MVLCCMYAASIAAMATPSLPQMPLGKTKLRVWSSHWPTIKSVRTSNALLASLLWQSGEDPAIRATLFMPAKFFPGLRTGG